MLGLCPALPVQVALLRNPYLQVLPMQLFPKMPPVFLPPEWSQAAAHLIPLAAMLLNTVSSCL